MTSHPDYKEPELTIPIVALGATAVSYIFDDDFQVTTISDAMI